MRSVHWKIRHEDESLSWRGDRFSGEVFQWNFTVDNIKFSTEICSVFSDFVVRSKKWTQNEKVLSWSTQKYSFRCEICYSLKIMTFWFCCYDFVIITISINARKVAWIFTRMINKFPAISWGVCHRMMLEISSSEEEKIPKLNFAYFACVIINLYTQYSIVNHL